MQFELNKIHNVDARVLLGAMGSGSVDLIVTDPPYPKEFIETFSWLAEGAKRVLRPGGYVFCYSGQLYLPEVVRRLVEHLNYRWTIALLHSQSQIVWPARAMAGWKPILVLQNGLIDEEGTPLLNDVIKPSGRDKRFHEWGQNEKDIGKIIQQYSKEDGLVCDPFIGGGTTAIVCEGLKRNWIGAEIDNVRAVAATERIERWRAQGVLDFDQRI